LFSHGDLKSTFCEGTASGEPEPGSEPEPATTIKEARMNTRSERERKKKKGGRSEKSFQSPISLPVS
jgi:hypothetical protein